MGPRAGLGGCEKSRLHRDSIPGPWRVAILTELSRLHFLFGIGFGLVGASCCYSLAVVRGAGFEFGPTDWRTVGCEGVTFVTSHVTAWGLR